MSKKPQLSPQQQKFIEYVVDGKPQSDAYSLAGYKTTTRNSLDAKASALVRNPKIALAIQERRAKLAEKADIKSEEIIRELKGMALANITDIIEWDEAGRTRVKASNQLEPYVKSSIKKIKSKTTWDKDGCPTHELELEMHSKEGPLRQLGEYLNLWKAKDGNTVIINQFLTQIQNEYGLIEAK